MHNAKVIDIFNQSAFEYSVEDDILCKLSNIIITKLTERNMLTKKSFIITCGL